MKLKEEKKEGVVRARIPCAKKKAVEKILHKLGIGHSEAINIFYSQIALRKGIPFSINIPNEKTEKVLNESQKGKNVKKFSSKEELYKDLGL